MIDGDYTIPKEVYRAIATERYYQELKWPHHNHTLAEWILILEKVMNDLKKSWVCGHGNEDALHELRQVTAVGVAAMEQCGAPERV